MAARKVYIIDDALDYRILLSQAFKEAGYKVYLAKDGMEAYIKFFKVKPDLVITDILLPRMRGDVLVKWLRGTPLGKTVPIVVVSGHKKMKDYLYELGVELFFEKPITIKEVLAVAKEVLDLNDEKGEIKKRIQKLRKQADKEPIEEAPVEMVKICPACHKTTQVNSTSCENCGNTRLHIVEKSNANDY